MQKKITIILAAVFAVLAAGTFFLKNQNIFGGKEEKASNALEWEFSIRDNGLILTAYKGSETTVRIPYEINGKQIVELSGEVFSGNRKIQKVIMPDSIQKIGDGIFDGFSKLSYVSLSNSITEISPRSFRGCVSLKEIAIPEKVTFIGNGAFTGCTALTAISIPSGVTSVGSEAFFGCTSLSDIQIPGSITNIGSQAFSGTSWLDNKKEDFVIVGNNLLIKYNGNENTVTIPEGITQITDAFENNILISEIKLPYSLTSVGGRAFSGCQSLKRVELPENVKSISDSAFRGCRNLEEIVLSKKLKRIGASAFQGCSSLVKITIPAETEYIGSMSFANCSGLKTVEVPQSVNTILEDAFLYSEISDMRVEKGTYAEKFAQELNIPYSYMQQEAGDFIFQVSDDNVEIMLYTGDMNEVEVPETFGDNPVTSISSIIFQQNRSINSVVLPSGIEEIPAFCFANMDKLHSVILPDGLKRINTGSFMNDKSLAYIEIPSSVEFIAEDAFDNCIGITLFAEKSSYAYEWASAKRIRVETDHKDKASVYSFVKKNGKNYISGYTGNDPEPELPVITGSGELVYGIIDGVVSGSDITAVTIPDGYESIGESNFSGNKNGIEVYMPRTLSYVGKNSFSSPATVIHGYNNSFSEEYAIGIGAKFLLLHDWEE